MAPTMERLQQQFQQRAIQAVNFRDVLNARSRFIGKVLKSEAYVFNGNPRGVVAGVSECPAAAELGILSAQEYEVGNMVETLMERGAAPRKAVVIYGVLGPDNLVLFSIAEPASAPLTSTPAP